MSETYIELERGDMVSIVDKENDRCVFVMLAKGGKFSMSLGPKVYQDDLRVEFENGTYTSIVMFEGPITEDCHVVSRPQGTGTSDTDSATV